jgi:phage repressor protein C with HTH and peptisase S24 domain
MIVGSRIQERIDAAGLNQSELARRLGLRQSTISSLVRGESRGSTYLHKIARELDTSIAYLEGETDDPAPGAGNVLSPLDRAKLRILENATEEQFVAIADYMRGRLDAIDASAAAAQQLDAVLLPEIDVSYSMGGGSEIEEYPVTQLVPLSRGWLATLTRTPASELFVARGEGDSMQPTILDGDIVIVDRSERALRGQDRIWAVAYGNFGMIKRLRSLPNGALQINSDNPAVSPIEAFDGEAHIIGRVVGVVRRV